MSEQIKITERPTFWTVEPLYDDWGNLRATRHTVRIRKDEYTVSFKDETETEVTIVLEPKNPPDPS